MQTSELNKSPTQRRRRRRPRNRRKQKQRDEPSIPTEDLQSKQDLNLTDLSRYILEKERKEKKNCN